MGRDMTLLSATLGDQGLLRKALLVIGGSLFIALAAQISVPMLPVPMTLQTLAILMVGFAFGSRLGAVTLLAYLAEGAAGLIGYAALIPTARLHFGKIGLEMHHLFVKPRVRGTGVGRALIAACRAEGLRRGCHYISVGTAPDNHEAGAFYERRGFERRMMHAPRFRIGLDQPLT